MNHGLFLALILSLGSVCARAQSPALPTDTLQTFLAQASTAEDWYQAARAYGKLAQPDSALVCLEAALAQGHTDIMRLLAEPALQSLRDSEGRWQRVAEAYARNNPQRLDTLAQLFADLPRIGPENFLPFYLSETQRYGYFHRQTGEVLIPPIFFDASLIGVCGYVVLPEDGLVLRINHRGQVSSPVQLLNSTRYGVADPGKIAPVLPEMEPRSGFVLHHGELLGIAPGYSEDRAEGFRYYAEGVYQGPFWYQDKAYLILEGEKLGPWGIIDEAGNPLSGYDFQHTSIFLGFPRPQDPVVFIYVEDGTVFQTLSGQELHRFPTTHLGVVRRVLPWQRELVEVHHQGATGIWDFAAERWVLEPQKQMLWQVQVAQADACYLVGGNVRPGIGPAQIFFSLFDAAGDGYWQDEEGTVYRPRRE